jgi:hypothetical protein
MTTEKPSPPPGSGREALMVWLKFLALLAGLLVFGLAIFTLRRSV